MNKYGRSGSAGSAADISDALAVVCNGSGGTGS
jgi:hypothetical protein